MKYFIIPVWGCVLSALSACSGMSSIGSVPQFSAPHESSEKKAMSQHVFKNTTNNKPKTASLWYAGRGSLLGDRRAVDPGDILTVVVEINERAEISNATSRSRTSNENLSIPNLFGLPQYYANDLPDGASFDSAIGITSSGAAGGDGSVRRQETLELRLAAVVIDVLPNGVLSIEGRQEVRVNFELRELLVSGFVRPEDISRQNEITYDKIASARISYGGRGHITDMQQPRYGNQVIDKISPF